MDIRFFFTCSKIIIGQPLIILKTNKQKCYRLFVAHSHISDPCSLSSHGHLNDRNTNYPEHVLHLLQGEKCYPLTNQQ